MIAVRDIEQAMRSVHDAGGEVLGEPHLMPNVGRYASFVDTEGNRSSMLEPDSA
jgi:predicted enzyme related to lactoylglutathione lyase